MRIALVSAELVGAAHRAAKARRRCGRDRRVSTNELTARLVHAKRTVPFVLANLIATDDPALIARWREALRREGVWTLPRLA